MRSCSMLATLPMLRAEAWANIFSRNFSGSGPVHFSSPEGKKTAGAIAADSKVDRYDFSSFSAARSIRNSGFQVVWKSGVWYRCRVNSEHLRQSCPKFGQGLSHFAFESLENIQVATQWSSILSLKVNLPHTINFRTECGADLVT